MMTKTYALEKFTDTIRGRIIVSCQALPGEPLYIEGGTIMHLMARAAKDAGAAAIRTNGVTDVLAIKRETGLPVIGLIKKRYPGMSAYITPTMAEVDALASAGADVIALDCTCGPSFDCARTNEFLAAIFKRHPDVLLMADISTLDEGMNAQKQGVHFIGTTMSGYTPYSPQCDQPDYALVEALSAVAKVPVIAEGRVHAPDQAVELLKRGAHSVVVGGAITRPLEIATRFIRAVDSIAP